MSIDQTVLHCITQGVYPDSEDVIASELSSNVLTNLRQGLVESRNSVRVGDQPL